MYIWGSPARIWLSWRVHDIGCGENVCASTEFVEAASVVGLRGKGWVQHQVGTEQERLAAGLGSGQWAVGSL